MENNTMNIFQRMSAITAEMAVVAKNLSVQTTKNSSYKAVSERDILDAVKPLEEHYGVYSYPVAREILESNLLESESTYSGNTTKKTTFMTRIRTVYRFVNVDKPEEYIETTTFAEGIDAQDKGSGKAMTYADKYALMKAYKISTGDDPDQEGSRETRYTRKAGAQPAPQTEIYACADCGSVIEGFAARNGVVYTARDVALSNKTIYGRHLCRVCGKKAKAAGEGGNRNDG